MKMWADLICAFAQFQKAYSYSLGELYASALCNNAAISRRLSMEDLLKVSEWMVANKFADFTSESKERIFVYWRSLQEIADAIHRWADATGRIGSVEIILDLSDDSANSGEIFYQMPVELIMKACLALQEVGKAEVFYSDDTDAHGVKFFAM